jgi:hypothetical protein
MSDPAVFAIAVGYVLILGFALGSLSVERQSRKPKAARIRMKPLNVRTSERRWMWIRAERSQ